MLMENNNQNSLLDVTRNKTSYSWENKNTRKMPTSTFQQ